VEVEPAEVARADARGGERRGDGQGRRQAAHARGRRLDAGRRAKLRRLQPREGHRSLTPPVTLRAMTEQDLPLLHEWLQQPHIVEWWGGEAERPTFAQ